MEEIRFVVNKNRCLKQLKRNNTVQSDHNIEVIVVEIEKDLFTELDLDKLTYKFKFDIYGKYLEKDPTEVDKLQDKIILRLAVTEDITQKDGIIEFAITGFQRANNMTIQRLNIKNIEFNIFDTIVGEDYFNQSLVEQYLDEITIVVDGAIKQVKEATGDAVDNYLKDNPVTATNIDYQADVINKPTLNERVIEGDKEMTDYNIRFMTIEELERLY